MNQNCNPAVGSTSRRTFLLSGMALATTLMRGGTASAANKASSTPQTAGASMESVTFKNHAIDMAGNVYFPKGFKAGEKYPAIVVVHPGGGVKEQVAGLYAQKLAEQGFITLAFDASHQGASGGMPRFLDDQTKRVGDIFSAVDYLTSLAYVDAGRIGALGICAGSGATVRAATAERRIKALATVSAVDVGAFASRGWNGEAQPSNEIAMLEAVAKQRTAEANGAPPAYGAYVPPVGDKTAPRDLQEAADYYLTPRGQHPNAPNKRLMTSDGYLPLFRGFDRVDTLLTQPLMIVAGSKAGSLWHSEELNAKAAGPKDFVVIEGATHMDLYDGAGAELAAQKLSPFFKRTL